MEMKEQLAKFLARELGLDEQKAFSIIEVPPDSKLGDLAFPCFELAKVKKKAPSAIAIELAAELKLPRGFKQVTATGPYLNFFVDTAYLAETVLAKVRKEKENFGRSDIGGKAKVVMDISSPNIAKPFGIGHLRSTVIGTSLYRIHKFFGYKPVSVNHLGDWGTQFGKLMVAFEKWGDDTDLEKEPIRYLLSLYVRFHDEAEKEESLNDLAREKFKKLEGGRKVETALWKKFRELSLEEFKKLYKVLKIDFDYYSGESFYNDKMEKALSWLQKKVSAKISDGALVVDLEAYGMPPVILRKSDGATTYHTRDITAALYRLQELKGDKLIYVVGSEQKLHFQQLFKVLELAGINKEKLIHVDFGLFRFPEGKMSTRKGKVIFLEEVLGKAINSVKKAIEEKNPDLKDKEAVAQMVGVGAIIFGDLSNDRVKNIDFDWDRMLALEGETGPYLQYTHARTCSILRKAVDKQIKVSNKVDFSQLKTDEEASLIKSIASFQDPLKEVLHSYKPHTIANYLIRFAQAFNEFYHKHQVLSDDEKLTQSRLLLVDCVRQVLKNGLFLLCIEAPEEM